MAISIPEVVVEDVSMVSLACTPKLSKLSKGICKKSKKETHDHSQSTYLCDDFNQDVAMIGPLSGNERLLRVQRFLNKKRQNHDFKKYSYKCRKQVADKRLRIKGRFVTKEQAFQILGLSQEELLEHHSI
jgi:hypothetical protein